MEDLSPETFHFFKSPSTKSTISLSLSPMSFDLCLLSCVCTSSFLENSFSALTATLLSVGPIYYQHNILFLAQNLYFLLASER